MECSTSEYGCGYGEGEGLHFQYLCPGIQVVKLNMLTLYHFFFTISWYLHTPSADSYTSSRCHAMSFHFIPCDILYYTVSNLVPQSTVAPYSPYFLLLLFLRFLSRYNDVWKLHQCMLSQAAEYFVWVLELNVIYVSWICTNVSSHISSQATN